MASLDELRNERIKKLKLLEDGGVNPYPVSSNREFSISDAIDGFTKFSKRKKQTILAGRVTRIRRQGGLVFLDFDDGTGVLQAMLKKNEIDPEQFKLFADTVDIGDFVELSGSLFTTKRKERTLQIKKWKMLAKALRPIPDKWAGLQDIEERFRKRYLDILMSKEVKERFILRSKIITRLRAILDGEGFLEVETPMLQQHAGGATALPFITHHNALDADLYLRIAPELYLKRLLIGGISKVYEIGRNFRNEGIDSTHNPEFTMLEFYESYSDVSKQMVFVEKILKNIAKSVVGKLKIDFDGNKIDFSKPFKKIAFLDLLKKDALINDPMGMEMKDLMLTARQLGVDVDRKDPRYKILDNIYKKVSKPKIIQPTYIVDYPAEFSPLAKRKEENNELIERFQLVVGGLELVNAFSELNDPLEQKQRFANQEKAKNAGDKEAQTTDAAYLEAMEYGMPPAGGVGIGVERLIMLFSDTHNIREAILFPTLRSRN